MVDKRPEDTNYEVKDSGDRTKYTTGAQRDRRVGKGRFDQIPPRAEARLAKLCEQGAIKYEAWNVAKGIPIADMLDSAKRHINHWLFGKRDEDHLIQAAWNCLWAAENLDRIRSGDLPRSLLKGLPPWTPELASQRADSPKKQDYVQPLVPAGRTVTRKFCRLHSEPGLFSNAVIYDDGTGLFWYSDSPDSEGWKKMGHRATKWSAEMILKQYDAGKLYEYSPNLGEPPIPPSTKETYRVCTTKS